MGDLHEHIFFTNYFAMQAQTELGIRDPKPVYDDKAIEAITDHFYNGHKNKNKPDKK